MKKLFLLALCALILCGCANTPPEETTASMETNTPTETTTDETTTAETTTEATTEAPIATETTYIESLGETKVKLSTMSEEDVRRILIEGGADIPDSYEIDYIRYLVRRYEDDPNYINGVSYSVAAKRLESIQNAVRAYYGLAPFDLDEWYHSWDETTASTETTYVETLGETKVKLSTMSEEDCRKILAEAGVEISETCNTIRVSAIFAALEEDTDLIAQYYDTAIRAFDGKFRVCAREYLALSEVDPVKYPKFSEMTDTQCAALLQSHDIEIPKELYGFDLKKELCAFESDPDHATFGAYIDYLAYFEDIRYALKTYYGIPDDSRSPTLMGKPRLSLMSDEECKQFLIDAGVTIPSSRERYPFHFMIWQYEQDPDYYHVASWAVLHEFNTAVREAVSEYYGMPLPAYWE